MSEPAPRPPQRSRAGCRGLPAPKAGQNFLLDENTAGDRRGRRAAARGSREVGRAVASSRYLAHATSRLCLEVDPRLVPVASEFLQPYPHAEVIGAGALSGKHARSGLGGRRSRGGPWHLVANLPYSISAPVLALVAGLERLPLSCVARPEELPIASAPQAAPTGGPQRRGSWRSRCAAVAGCLPGPKPRAESTRLAHGRLR